MVELGWVLSNGSVGFLLVCPTGLGGGFVFFSFAQRQSDEGVSELGVFWALIGTIGTRNLIGFHRKL